MKAAKINDRGPTQRPLFGPTSTWRAPDLASLPSWRDAKRLCVDVETRDPTLSETGIGCRRGAYIVGYSFAIEDHPRSYYIPMRHQGGGNLDPVASLAYLRDQAQAFRGELCNAGLPYDLDFLAEEGVTFNAKRYLDPLLAATLCDERHGSYSLNSVARRLGFEGKDENLLEEAAAAYRVSPKGGLWRFPASFVGPYGEADAALPLKSMRLLEREMAEQELLGVWELECRVLPALVAMRRRGVRFSPSRLAEVDRWAESEELLALAKVRELSGILLGPEDVNMPDQVGRVLTACGVPLGKTPGGKVKVDDATLKNADHPAADALRRAKKFNKLRGTFVASVRKYAIGDRVHPSFNQLKRSDDEDRGLVGTITGRLSCDNPNLQQQPSRDKEIVPRGRSIYVPDDGCVWGSVDYASQEPRMLVHYAEICGFPGAREAGDRYRADPHFDVHGRTSKVLSIDRYAAKIVFLARCYGMGEATLCHKLRLPTVTVPNKKYGGTKEVAGPVAAQLIARVNDLLPFLKAIDGFAKTRARTAGFIRTLSGRRCRFMPDGRGGVQDDYTALNKLVQGSSADQMKMALANAFEAGMPLQLQVHDELAGSFVDTKQIAETARIMEEAVPLRVPSLAEQKEGPSWGEAKAAG